jgi:cytochrome c oxidase subunit 2
MGFGLDALCSSTLGSETDLLFLGLLLVTGAAAGLVFCLLVAFCVRYREGSDADRSDRVRKSWIWEIGWTAATFVAFLGLFVWGADVYAQMFRPPADALAVRVIGKQWMWQVQHPGGQREINELHVPIGRPIRLVMTSQDVIHSFFVPAFRLKRDVLPGRDQELWFQPTRTGAFRLMCAEFCGTDHSHMGGRVVVMSAPDFEAWLAKRRPEPALVAEGAALFRSLGCSGCHGAAATVHAPSLDGLYGRPVPLQDGRVVTADERYIRDSILLPPTEVAAGYPTIMPSFAGRIGDDDLERLVAYIKSLGEERDTR